MQSASLTAKATRRSSTEIMHSPALTLGNAVDDDEPMTEARDRDHLRARARFLLAMGLPIAAAAPVSCGREPAPDVAKTDKQTKPKATDTAEPTPTPTETAASESATVASVADAGPPRPFGPSGGGGCGFEVQCVPGFKVPPMAAASAPYGLCANSRPAPAKSGGSLHVGEFDADQTDSHRLTEKKPDLCCYKHPRAMCGGGRVLRSSGGEGPIVTEPIERDDWFQPSLADLALPADASSADHWLREASFEHASIASFSRVALELLSLGAPADLVADTASAALDEIVHARICYSLARAYGATALGPGLLAVASTKALATTFEALAVETFLDGCISETTASLELRERARCESEPRVHAVLLRMAEDEERHAELSFRTVAWSVRRGGAGVLAALETALAEVDDSCASLPEARAMIIREVVTPCIRTLLVAGAVRTSRRASAPASCR